MEPQPLTPPLKWAGGKRWQLPLLRPLWAGHQHRRLVEPFCGGLAVPLGLRPATALLNDLNPHLVNFYRWVQRGLSIDVAVENDRDLYYAHRTRFNALLEAGGGDTPEAAALFYFLNRTGYNGLCRFNRRNEFNVPFGRYRKISYATDLYGYRDALRSWSFSCVEFDALPVEPDDFIYADPPYDVDFRQYSPRGFSWDDQVRTAQFLASHPDRSCSPTRPRRGSLRSTIRSAMNSACSTHQGGSAATATARPPGKCSRCGTCSRGTGSRVSRVPGAG